MNENLYNLNDNTYGYNGIRTGRQSAAKPNATLLSDGRDRRSYQEQVDDQQKLVVDPRDVVLEANYRGSKFHVKWLYDPTALTPTVAQCSPHAEMGAAVSVTPEQAEQFSYLFGASGRTFQSLMALLKAVRDVTDTSPQAADTDHVAVRGNIDKAMLHEAMLALYSAANVPFPFPEDQVNAEAVG